MAIAVIGAGRWGMNCIRTLADIGDKAKWVYSRTDEGLKEARKTGTRTTTNYWEIIEDSEVEAAIIATAAQTHYKIAKDFLNAGKHIIIEKPMTMDSKEAEELGKIANEKKLTLMTGHVQRFNPGIQKAKELIDAGKIGKIRYVQLVTTSNLARDDTDVLWDFLPHEITILKYILENNPETVSASGKSYNKTGRIDVAEANFSYSEGIIASCFISWVHPVKQRTVIITGNKGSLHFDDVEKKLTQYDKEGNQNDVEFSSESPLTLEIKHFKECFTDRKNPLTDANEGIDIVRTIEKMHYSIRAGKDATVQQ